MTRRIRPSTSRIRKSKWSRKRGGTLQAPAEQLHAPDPRYNLQKINTINGVDIYRFTIDGCFHYLYNNFNALHLYIATEPPTILDFGDTKLSDADKENILAFMRDARGMIAIQRELHNYKVTYYRPYRCFQPLDLSVARKQIGQLNDIIHDRKCGFELSLDYIYESKSSEMSIFSSPSPTVLVLCLTLGDQCISSIMLDIDSNYLVISSKTKEEYQGRKYNTLLRCVVMIIAQSLSPIITSVMSFAINPISAYLLVQKFDGIITTDTYEDFINTREVPPDVKSRIGMYKTYIESIGKQFGLDIDCPLNEATIHKNNELFPVYLTNSCT